jgi:oligosaccharide repeat unit polymerase
MDDFLIEKIIAIVFSLLILCLAWVTSRYAKSWLVPSVVFSVFWFLYSFLPLVFLPEVPINVTAVIYIFIFCLIFSSSAYFFDWQYANRVFDRHKVKNNRVAILDTSFIRRTFFIVQIFVVFTVFLDVIIQGFSFYDVIFNFMETSSAYISLRYSGELKESIIVRLGTVFTYVGVMLGGFVACFCEKRRNVMLVTLLSLLPSVLLMVIQGAKGSVFLCVFLFYGSVLIYKMYHSNRNLTDRKTNKIILYGIVALTPAIVSSFLSRGLYDQDTDYILKKLFFYFNSYAFAHLYAFSDWFNAYIGYESLLKYHIDTEKSYGFYTFMSLFKSLGVNKYVPPGVYEEYYMYKDIIKSNIYTVFRGLITDFGIVGSLIFAFVFGWLLNFMYFCINITKNPNFLLSVYIAMYGFYYTSFIISIFIWNSLPASLLIFYIIISVNQILISKYR